MSREDTSSDSLPTKERSRSLGSSWSSLTRKNSLKNVTKKLTLTSLKPKNQIKEQSFDKQQLVHLNILSKSTEFKTTDAESDIGIGIDNKNKKKAPGVKFGVPLSETLEEGETIPSFVLKATSFLEKNGKLLN